MSAYPAFDSTAVAVVVAAAAAAVVVVAGVLGGSASTAEESSLTFAKASHSTFRGYSSSHYPSKASEVAGVDSLDQLDAQRCLELESEVVSASDGCSVAFLQILAS